MIWRLAASAARLLPPEAAHVAAVKTLQANIGPRPHVPSLPVSLAGLDFANPLGVAAGFDKNAACYKGAMGLGFGHVEVGTITPLAQPGNPKPRVFRLSKDAAVINRYGFNSQGMEVAAANLARVRDYTGILGVNVGANKTSPNPTDDYRVAVACLARFADYVTLNISSPNTPGLRDLQTQQHLAALLDAARTGMQEAGVTRPLFLKIAPDLEQADLELIVDHCVSAGVHGIIATNTTISRPDSLRDRQASQTGGLSGQPLFTMATDILSRIVQLGKGRIGVIGVGGVAHGWQAYAKILVGADLVQLYSGLALDGPLIASRILHELAILLDKDGVSTVGAICGTIPDPQAAIRHAFRCAQTG
ncbi:quinone-dependent dihydroorotate dehydrogenase [Candidatus Puniceispirillum marinum]|uniref:Dihydroorotate dehydrogenase (quinone) n=1 Tax=Puniceispirillum marinum (strain IMCC1322) TaxID=488538 RepID=D5BMV2_PUNMI|nr:quinone-dependent dihydroorotate dehydrogenase [Candidatus Puniceispirillum marinum]ADE40145.1 Dihydroorotate dehydrogenase [Candidatus Puniceispirillum marinum IMCC1322]